VIRHSGSKIRQRSTWRFSSS